MFRKKFFLLFLFFTLIFPLKAFGDSIKLEIIGDDGNLSKKVIISFKSIRSGKKIKGRELFNGVFIPKKLRMGAYTVRLFSKNYYPEEFFLYYGEGGIFPKKVRLFRAKNWENKEIFKKASKYFIEFKNKKSLKLFKALYNFTKDDRIKKILAYLYFSMKDYASLEKMLDIKRMDNKMRGILAYTFVIRDRFSNTLDIIKSLNPKNITNPIISKELGKFFYEREEYRKAIPFLKNALYMFPDYPKAVYYLGLSYAAINEREKAIEMLTKFIKLEPDSADVVIADSVIRTLKEISEEENRK